MKLKRFFFTFTIIFFLLILYIALVKLFRPFIYSNYINLNFLVFIVGVAPNFLGSIMMYLLMSLIPKMKVSVIIFFCIFLILFIEIESFYNRNISFDYFDILASLVGIFLVHTIMKNITKIPR